MTEEPSAEIYENVRSTVSLAMLIDPSGKRAADFVFAMMKTARAEGQLIGIRRFKEELNRRIEG